MDALVFLMLVIIRGLCDDKERLVAVIAEFIARIDLVDSFDDGDEFVEIVVPMLAGLSAIWGMNHLDSTAQDPDHAMTLFETSFHIHDHMLKEVVALLRPVNGMGAPADVALTTVVDGFMSKLPEYVPVGFPDELKERAADKLLFIYRSPAFAKLLQTLQQDELFDA